MIKNINVRFFIYDEDQNDIKEVQEFEFLECKHPLSYERDSIFENGCRQICLTKCPNF